MRQFKNLTWWFLTMLPLFLHGQSGVIIGQQPVDVHRTAYPFEVLYKGRVNRNLSTYPLTNAGQRDLENAASTGGVNLTVVCPNGTLVALPAGTRPPLTPPCNSVLSSVTSNIGLAARYTFSADNGGTLVVRASGLSGASYTMKLVGDGRALSLKNKDYPVLNQNTNYPPGVVLSSDNYTLDWTLWGVTPGMQITQTFTKDGVTFSRTYTPQLTIAPQQLFLAGNSSPPVNPDPPVNPQPGGTMAGGYGEGTFAQLVAFAPFAPSDNQLGSWPQGNTWQYLTSSSGKKAGWLKSVGAALAHLSEGGGKNWVNTFDDGNSILFEGAHKPNTGRSAGPSTYGTPGGANQFPFCAYSPVWNGGSNECTSKGPTSDDTGWNPVVGGDAYNYSAKMLWYERKTVNGKEVVYFRSQPLQWSLHNVLAEQINHMWYWWDTADNLKFFYIIENFRSDTQMSYFGRQNELPFAYLTADLFNYYIPNLSGGLQQINKGAPCEGSDGSCNQNDTGDFISAQNWIAGVNSNGRGVMLLSPYCAQVGGKQFQGRDGNEFSNASAYINTKVQTNFDVKGFTAWAGSFYVGGLSDFRSWLAANPVQTLPLSFSFSTGKTAGWYGEDAAAKFNGSNEYYVSIGQKNSGGQAGGSFCSPWGGFKAAEITTIYIKAKVDPGINDLNLQWARPGDEAIYIEQNNNKRFSVIADGQPHTYVLQMSGVSNWNGLIGRIKIKLPYPYQSTAGSEKFTPIYIGTINPN